MPIPNSFPQSECKQLLAEAVSGLGLPLSEHQLDQLATHFFLLLHWNRKINLTAVRRPEEIATRHFEESLFLAKIVEFQHGLLVDVGSGAGFPGLPIKIAFPSLETVLLEPNKKKAAFLKEVVRRCGLERVEVRTERLEEAGRGGLATQATLVTVRAVRPPQELLNDLAKLLIARGQLALFLGAEDANTVNATPGFHWAPPTPIPPSRRRVLLRGRLV